MVDFGRDYFGIGMVGDVELFRGDNGRDGFGEYQVVEDRCFDRRLGRVRVRDIFLDVVVWPVERLVMDQYGNYYYGWHCVGGDGDVWSWCERVRTVEWKRGYELGCGWDVALKGLRARAEVALLSSLKFDGEMN